MCIVKCIMPSQLWLTVSFYLIACFILICPCNGLQVQGIWSPSSKSALKVVARFGIQKSVANHKEETNGYVFGNFTILSHYINQSENNNDNQLNNAVLLFVNRTLFKQIYYIYSQYNTEDALNNNSKQQHKSSFCERVYDLIQDEFYDSKCGAANKSNYVDFVRYVPCPKGKTCNELSETKPLPNYQFTFVIDNQSEPTFWFLLLLSCQRKVNPNIHANSTHQNCTWISSANVKSLISYDIWLVNGNPDSASNKLIDFDHQFSFEQQNLFMYLLLNLSYVILLILQLYALSFQKIRGLNYLFTISLSLHCLAYFFICCHKIVFAHNGRGFDTLNTIADIMKIMSTALFILFVLMIAKGWPITKPEIFSKSMLLIIWSIYTLIKILLFIWIKDSLNYIEEVDEYHTIPGWISLGFRIILMLWFLHELRHTMILEQDPQKLRFYLHFGAGMLVWFVHLPLVAMVALQIDLMWRYKIITGFTSAADVFAYVIVTRLMLQRKHNQFGPLETDDFNDELEYYDQHSINSETYKFTKANYRSKHSYDNHINCDINPIKS